MMNREPGAQYRALAIHNAADAGQPVELAQLVAAAGGVADVWVGKLKRTALMKACHRVRRIQPSSQHPHRGGSRFWRVFLAWMGVHRLA